MLSYIILGANDIPRSERFYTAVLEPLGYEKAEQKDAVIYTLPDIPDRFNGPCAVYVKKPYDGREATVGNGSMIAFRAPTHAQVHALHSAGIAAGGTDDGAPGLRPHERVKYYAAFVLDPDGNRIEAVTFPTD